MGSKGEPDTKTNPNSFSRKFTVTVQTTARRRGQEKVPSPSPQSDRQPNPSSVRNLTVHETLNSLRRASALSNDAISGAMW
jgi:hypothetical protein